MAAGKGARRCQLTVAVRGGNAEAAEQQGGLVDMHCCSASMVTEERGVSVLQPPSVFYVQSPPCQLFLLKYTLHIHGNSEFEDRLLSGSAQHFC